MGIIFKSLFNYIHEGCYKKEKQLEKEVATLKEKRQSLEERLSSAEMQLLEFKQQAWKRDKQIKVLSENALKERIRLQSELDRLENEKQSLEGRLSSADMQLVELTQHVWERDKQIKDLSENGLNERTRLQSELDRLESEKQSLEGRLSSTDMQLEQLNQQVRAQDLQIVAMTASNQEQTLLLQELRAQCEKLQQESSALQKQLHDAQEELAKAKQYVLERQAQSAETQLVQAQQEIVCFEDKEQTTEGLNTSMGDMIQEVIELEDDINQASKEQCVQVSTEAHIDELNAESVVLIADESLDEDYYKESKISQSVKEQTSPIEPDIEGIDSEGVLVAIAVPLAEAPPITDLERPSDDGVSLVLGTASCPDEAAEESSDIAKNESQERELRGARRPFDLSRLGKQLDDKITISAKDGEQKKYTRITEVVEVATGKSVSAEEILSRDRAELLFLRKQQQESIMGLRPPLYKCPECGEVLNLAGDARARGKVTHFQHTRRTREEISAKKRECPLRSANDLSRPSRAEIDASKYTNAQGECHRVVKETLAEFLQQTPGVNSLYVEKNVTSEIEGLEWKRPDIQFEYRDRRVICELQVSSTYLSVITERELFYRLKQCSVLWVFCFEEDRQQAEFEMLFIRDIYYANKRNAFIFTKEAYEASRASNILHLTCVWFEPCIEDGVYDPDRVVRRSRLITLDDLSFDVDTYKPYYIDAEAMFAQYNRPFYNAYTCSYQLSLIDVERAASVFLARKQARDKLRLARLQRAKAEQDEARELLVNSDVQITLFEDRRGKWGYKVGDVIVEPATYNSAELYADEELILLYKGRRYQFIDYKGVELGPVFHELFPVFKSKCFIRIGKEYCLLDLSSGESMQVEYKSIVLVDGVDYLLMATYSIFRGQYGKKYITADGAIEFDVLESFYNGVALAKRVVSRYVTSFWGRTSAKEEYWGAVNQQGEIIIPFAYSALEPFENGLVRARRNNSWGIIGLQGEIIIPFAYSALEPFENGLVRARCNNSWGVIDLRGETVIPFAYSALEPFENGLVRARRNNSWGVIDLRGETVIPFEYSALAAFENGLIQAKLGSSWGAIDLQGKVIIPFEYNALEAFDDGVARAKKDGCWGKVDCQGKPVSENVEEVATGVFKAKQFEKWGLQDESENVIFPYVLDCLEAFENDLARAKEGDYWGVIDLQGKSIIPFEYSALEPFENGLVRARCNNSWGVIDLRGETVIPFEYSALAAFENGLIRAKLGSSWGAIDLQGKIIIPFEYNALEAFDDGVARAKKDGCWGKVDCQGKPVSENVEEVATGVFKAKQFEKWGLQDESKNVIFPYVLDCLEAFENDLARAKEGDYWGVIDLQGRLIIPFEYSALAAFENGLIRAKLGSSWGAIDLKGRAIIPFEYNALEAFDDGVARAKKDSCWGKVDCQGKPVSENVEELATGVFKAKQFEKWGLQDESENVIFPYVLDCLEAFENALARARRNNSWGVIDLRGETVIPFEYNVLEAFDDGVARAKKDGCWGKVDCQGKPVSENVEEVATGVFKAKQFEKWGLQDKDGQVICSFRYDEVVLSRGGCIGYKGEFRTISRYRPKGTFTAVELSSTEDSILEAVVVNQVPYGIFISVKGMPATLIHKSALNKAGLPLKIVRGSKVYVVAVGLNKKYHSMAVKLVGVTLRGDSFSSVALPN